MNRYKFYSKNSNRGKKNMIAYIIKNKNGEIKELKDIVLKKGDIVVWTDGIETIYDEDDIKISEYTIYTDCITKIERPVKYETIYEAPKQILDKEEKEYLENVVRPAKENVYKLRKEFVNDSCYRIRITNNVKIDKIIIDVYPSDKYSFKGMEVDKEYTLKELGLFE